MDTRGATFAELTAQLRAEIRAKLEQELTGFRRNAEARVGRSRHTSEAPPAAEASVPEATRFGATQTCPSCGGTGRGTFSATCGTCSGSGYIGTY